MNKQAIIKKILLFRPVFWVLVCSVALMNSVAMAKSLYVAGNTNDKIDDMLWVYDVQQDGTLVMQTTKTMPSQGNYGVNGLGVDPNSETLFLTYKGFHHAGLIDVQTLDWQGLAYIPPLKMNPGGLVYDEIRDRFYTTDVLASDEVDDRLLIYDWDAENNLLLTYWSQDVTWTGASSVSLARENAGPLAFDKTYEVVYVAIAGGGIDAYKTSHERESWQSIRTYETAYEAKAVTVDPINQLLYVGGTKRNRGALIDRINLVDGTTFQFETGGINDEVLSLSVNDGTGLLYALIGDSSTSVRTIKVFDSNFKLFQTVSITGDARQLLVPNTYKAYNPLDLTITPVSGVVESNGNFVAGPGAEIEYQICLTNSSAYPVTQIAMTSILPENLVYNGTSELTNALGSYAPQIRTFWYNSPFIGENSTQCFSLYTTVSDDAMAGSIMSTTVVVDSNETNLSEDRVDVQVGFNALGLTKEVVLDPNFLVVDDKIYVDPGAYVTYRICLNNLANANAVTNILLTDQFSDYVEFVNADLGGIASFYEEDLHTYSWVFQSIEPNSTVCLDVIVRLKDNLTPGSVISNQVFLGGSEVDNPPAAHANIVVKHNALAVDTTVKHAGDYNVGTNQIIRGGVLTFLIDVINLDQANAAENIVVTDYVSDGLYFLNNVDDVNGTYDSLAEEFRMELPFLGPGQAIHSELTFVVEDYLPGGTILTNYLIAIANGGPASSTSVSLSVLALDEPNVPVEPNEVSTTLDLYYNGPPLRNDPDEIMVIMRFPAHINGDDIDELMPLIMTPGSSTALHRDIAGGLNTNYFVFGDDGNVRVKGFFDRQPVFDALAPGQKTVTLTVTGWLKTGNNFVGQATVPVN